jgi:hypothetical protein
MYDPEAPELLLPRQPSPSDFWLRGFSHAYRGLPAAEPNDLAARDAYRRGFAAGTAHREQAPFRSAVAVEPVAGPADRDHRKPQDARIDRRPIRTTPKSKRRQFQEA